MAAPRVLFVCRRNAGRSQMAAAFTAHHGQGRVIVASAGTAPADSVDPTVAVAMREVGIDIRQNLPRRISESDVRATDICITMGCGDQCPVLPNVRYLDWPFDDPHGRHLADVRPIRDGIERNVQALLAELGVQPNPVPSWLEPLALG